MRIPVLAVALATAVPAAAQTPVSVHVAGHVVDAETGAGVDSAQVMLLLTTISTAPLSVRGAAVPRTTTDAEGAFAFEVGFAGRYRVVANKEGLVRSDPSPTVDVVVGRPVYDVVVTLSRGGSIAGYVRGADGRTGENFRVTALRRRIEADGRVATSMGPGAGTAADGSFAISTVAAGEYVVAASPPSANGSSGTASISVAPTFFPGTTDLQSAQPIVVARNETITGLDFQMQLTASTTIEGLVVRDDGSPVFRAWIVLTRNPRNLGAGPMRPIFAWSHDDGTFKMTDVLPGTYAVLASIPVPRQPGVDFFLTGPSGESLMPAPPGSPRGSVSVTVGSEGLTDLRIVLR